MQRNIIHLSRSRQRRLRQPESGVALLTTLLLLLLLTGLSLAMVISVRSDLLINGYYRNFRGSYYAADSGLNIARAAMIAQLNALVPTTVVSNSDPMPAGSDTTVQTSLNTAYGTNSNINSGGSWPESFSLDTNQTKLLRTGCVAAGGTSTNCAAAGTNATSYTYSYSYTLAAVGQARGGEKATISDSGNFTLVINTKVGATTTTTTTTSSFAAWGMFIDKQTVCNGSTLVPGNISGPVFTNGSWTFGDTGSYNFSDSVGQVGPDPGFQFSNGTCDQNNPGPADTNKGTTIAPKFNQGFKPGQAAIPLPPNAFSQERAVLDGKGTSSATVKNSDLNAALKNINKTAYPSGGAGSGVYLPYKTVDALGNAIPATLTGGGIYVEGDAQVTLTPSGTNGQKYTIVNNGTTTVVTITPGLTPGSGTTQVDSGGTTLVIAGVPAVQDASSNPTSNGTMLFVNGDITKLQGPGEGQAAVNDGTALTITAANNVTITGDIRYKTEPVTLTANPALVTGADKGQVLGIFTATGDIQLDNKQSDQKLQIDASLATISANGTGGLTNTGNSIDTLSIVGGRIQNSIKGINTTTRNVYFDRRFSSNGFSPPWFPSTTFSTTTTTSTPNDTTTPGGSTFVRSQWLYNSGLQ